MYTLTLILLFAKCLFVAATDNQFFVVSTSEPPSTLDLILAELKENKQQLQNFEKNNKDHLENLEQKAREQLQNLENLARNTREQLQNLEQANRQQLQNLEQTNRQQLQILEQANKQQLQLLEQKTREELHNLEQANRQQLQMLEQANKQHLQTLEQKTGAEFDNLKQANREQLQSLEQANKEQFKNLESRLKETKKSIPKNCKEVLENGNNVTGIYKIRPESAPESFLVLCDMDSRGGGWTYLLNRLTGKPGFNVNWNDYKKGFGNLAGDFWLGLENLYHLTGLEINELLIKVVDRNSNKNTAHYSQFSIGDESQGYYLKLLGGYSGDAGDYLTYHEGMKFTTRDRDQDVDDTVNCAVDRSGGWWYHSCTTSHLTGDYFSSSPLAAMYWVYGPKLKEAKMMVRPIS